METTDVQLEWDDQNPRRPFGDVSLADIGDGRFGEWAACQGKLAIWDDEHERLFTLLSEPEMTKDLSKALAQQLNSILYGSSLSRLRLASDLRRRILNVVQEGHTAVYDLRNDIIAVLDESVPNECPHGWMGWERRFDPSDLYLKHPIDEKVFHSWKLKHYKHCPDCGDEL